MTKNKTGICDKCNKKAKKLRVYKGKFYCYSCYNKLIIKMPFPPQCIKLKDALNKVREVRCIGTINPFGSIHLPRVLIGKKVKLVLLEKK